MEMTTIPMPRPRNPQVDMMAFRKLVERVEELERKLEVKRGRPAKEKDNGDSDE